MQNFKLQPKHFALISFVTLMLILMVVALIGSQTKQEYRSRAAYPTPQPSRKPTKPPPELSGKPTKPPRPSPSEPPPPPGEAYIIVQSKNPQLTPVAADKLCKVQCSSSPCNIGSCVSNQSSASFAGAKAGNGGRINDPDLTVVGVSPVPANGSYSPDCRGAGGQCYYWNTGTKTGNRKVVFIVTSSVTIVPTITSVEPTNTPAPGCPKKSQGDANCDGNVDGVDYSIWLNTQCPSTRPTNAECASYDADFNGDKNIDDVDYEIWLQGSRL